MKTLIKDLEQINSRLNDITVKMDHNHTIMKDILRLLHEEENKESCDKVHQPIEQT